MNSIIILSCALLKFSNVIIIYYYIIYKYKIYLQSLLGMVIEDICMFKIIILICIKVTVKFSCIDSIIITILM